MRYICRVPQKGADAREAWLLMSEIFWSSRRDWVATLGELGLAPMQAMALRQLDPERPVPMSGLADALRCDNSNVTGITDRLESAGLVERRPVPNDRRVKGLVLTERGREMRAEVERRWSQPPEPLAQMAPEDARALRDTLRRALGR
jgi:DNA-binding MarR family transcriptional regulator